MVAWLADAEAVNLGPGTFPQPVKLSAAEAYANAAQHEKFDGEFVKMKGRCDGLQRLREELYRLGNHDDA
jgi:hypothetical protein